MVDGTVLREHESRASWLLPLMLFTIPLSILLSYGFGGFVVLSIFMGFSNAFGFIVNFVGTALIFAVPVVICCIGGYAVPYQLLLRNPARLPAATRMRRLRVTPSTAPANWSLHPVVCRGRLRPPPLSHQGRPASAGMARTASQPITRGCAHLMGVWRNFTHESNAR